MGPPSWSAALAVVVIAPLAAMGTVVDVVAGTALASATASGATASRGYRLVAADGGVFSFNLPFAGSVGGSRLNQPMVGGADTPAGHGYWLVAADGGVFAFGDARYAGSTGMLRLNQPIVGMAPTPTGAGYWLVARDGGIFAFGDARFLGSAASLRLGRPIVGMAATATGSGYWLVAADGGVFAFGDAGFLGSASRRAVDAPIVGMAAMGDGYWLVSADGAVLPFGRAESHGSLAGRRLRQPIVGMASEPSGRGYWLVARDGGVFAFGGSPFVGSTGQLRLNQPIVAISPPSEPGESIAPGTYREPSDNRPSFTIQGGRAVTATSGTALSGAERIGFIVNWHIGSGPSRGRISASLTNLSGVQIRFPDGLRVVIGIFRDGQLWTEIPLGDPDVRQLEPGAHLFLLSAAEVAPDGDGQYHLAGETTIVLT